MSKNKEVYLKEEEILLIVSREKIKNIGSVKLKLNQIFNLFYNLLIDAPRIRIIHELYLWLSVLL